MRPRAVALSAAAVLLAVASSAVRTCRPASVVAVLSAVGWPLAACPLVAPLASPADNRRAVLPSHDAVAALARPLVESPPDGSEPLVQTLSVAVVTTAGGTRTYHFGVVGGRTGGGATASAPDGGSSASGGGSEGASAATESAAPPTDATVYELGSITKAFTGLLVSDLVARSPHVRLDTPVNALLPPGVGLPGRRGGAVTLRHLLTHTSGLPREAPAMPLADGAAAEAATDNAVAPTNYSVDHLYALLGRETLPRLGLTARACGGGAPRVYSNYAVGLGGHAVGRAVGAPSYAAALDAAVLRPLGLAATTIGGPSAATDPAPATAAAPADVDGRPAPEHRMTDARAAAGGLRSSVADLTSWAAFCLDACRGGDGSAAGVGGGNDPEATARRAHLAAALRSAWHPPLTPLPAWMPAAVRGVVGAVRVAACGPPASLSWFRVPPPGTTGFRGGSTPFRRPPTAWYSAGGTPGFTTALYVDPTIGLAVLAAGNVGGSGAVFDLAVDVRELAAGGSPAPPPPPASGAKTGSGGGGGDSSGGDRPPPDVTALLGTYSVPGVGTVCLRAGARGAGLTAVTSRGHTVRWLPSRSGGGGGGGDRGKGGGGDTRVDAGRVWEAAALGATATFEGPPGRADSFIVKLWGRVLRAPRVADGGEGGCPLSSPSTPS